MAAWLNARRASAETIRTDVFNPAALAETLESLAGRYDGVAVVALDHQSVRAAIDDLVAGGTHVVTVVSDVPGSRRHHYVGIDNVAAGRTAGSLIGRFVCGRKRQGRDHRRLPFAARSRRAGVRPQSGDEPRISATARRSAPLEGGDRDDANEALTARLLTDHPDLIGLYNVGAGTPGVMKALGDAGREGDVAFIAHDLTPSTRRGLLRGVVDAVIVQDPGPRGALGDPGAAVDGAPRAHSRRAGEDPRGDRDEGQSAVSPRLSGGDGGCARMGTKSSLAVPHGRPVRQRSKSFQPVLERGPFVEEKE